MSFLKIGTRSRYALRFMIELAEVERAARSDETRRRGYVKLRTIASSQDISWRYLEQIAPALAEAGMVETGRGRSAATGCCEIPQHSPSLRFLPSSNLTKRP